VGGFIGVGEELHQEFDDIFVAVFFIVPDDDVVGGLAFGGLAFGLGLGGRFDDGGGGVGGSGRGGLVFVAHGCVSNAGTNLEGASISQKGEEVKKKVAGSGA
jgi:hypothetical protein